MSVLDVYKRQMYRRKIRNSSSRQSPRLILPTSSVPARSSPARIIRNKAESVFQLQYNLPVDIREAIFSISGIGNASRMPYADDMRIYVNISFDKELKVGMGYDLLCSGLMLSLIHI